MTNENFVFWRNFDAASVWEWNTKLYTLLSLNYVRLNFRDFRDIKVPRKKGAAKLSVAIAIAYWITFHSYPKTALKTGNDVDALLKRQKN